MSTTTKNTPATVTVSQGESRYGTPEPQIAVRFPKGTSYCVVKATLHKLAAEIELATPASERWCVNTEDFNESGRVYLERTSSSPTRRPPRPRAGWRSSRSWWGEPAEPRDE